MSDVMPLPLPWRARATLSRSGEWQVDDARGNPVCDRLAESDAVAVANGRNALGVMVRRGWGVGFAHQEGPNQGWFVRLPESFFPIDSRFYPLANMRRSDPFTVLVDADGWYKANVEAISPQAAPTP